jgi:hypothetical protein
MRIWHALVAVLVVALLMPIALPGGGIGLLVLVPYLLLLCIWFGLHRLWWVWLPRVGAAHQTSQRTAARSASGCLSTVILFAYCLVTILAFFATGVMIVFWFIAMHEFIRPPATPP